MAALAARQHGIVTSAQLATAGLEPDAVGRRCASGLLTRLHRGVYRVGPVAAPLAREAAALLAVGGDATLSHHSAAGLWGFRSRWEGDVQVTVGSDRGRGHRGIRVHRTADLEATVHAGLPVTHPGRTLLDLAGRLSQRDLDRAVEQAQVLGLVTHRELARRAASGRRGVAALARALRIEAAMTRSEAEQRLRRLVRRARLPAPEVNARVLGHEVDFLWRDARLVVELDGFAYHSSRAAFERDRLRDADLVAAGYRVVRLTWRQLTDESEAVIARLAALLA